MAGTSQASNLSGMLTSIGNTIGEMGEPGKAFAENIRTLSAPKLDMDNPESMRAYAEYLRRNGKEQEAIAMLSQAEGLARANKARSGQSAIMGLAAPLRPGMDEAERQKVMTAIGRIADNTGIEPLQVQQLLEVQNIKRRETMALESDTASKAEDRTGRRDLEQQRIDDNFNIAMNELDLSRDRLAETVRSNLAQEGLTSRGMDINEYQFGETMDFERDQFAEKQRINEFLRWKGKEEIRQGDKGLTLEEARVEIARDLANEDIKMGEFRRIIMGNEDRRAEDMHPIERDLKEAQVRVATANAGYTEAQTADVLYELGFKRDTESLREDALELRNELTEEEIKNARSERDYLKERTKAVTAEVELNYDRYNLEARRQAWDMGIQESELKLRERIANSQIELRSSQVDEIAASINSTVLRDELLVAKAESEKISEAYKVAYTWPVDLNSPTAIANAKQGFIATYGKEFAMDFDDAVQQRIKVQNLIDETGADALLRADSRPKTVSQLEAAGMSPQDIDAYKLLTDPQQKNQFVQTWAKRMNTPEVGGAPTKALMEIYSGAAERMQKDIFGSGFFWSGAFNGVWDNDVREDITLAMASAAASGKTSNEVWLAGLEATFPYLQDAGSASSAQAAKGYAEKYGD